MNYNDFMFLQMQDALGNNPWSGGSIDPFNPPPSSGGGNPGAGYPGGYYGQNPFSTVPYGMVPPFDPNSWFSGAGNIPNPVSVYNPGGGGQQVQTPGGPPIIWNNTFPLPSGGGAPPPGAGGIAGPNTGGLYPGGLPQPPGGTPSTGGWGTRGDDSGRVPGVDLSWRDRVNMGFKTFGLPPLPANYNPFDPFGGYGSPQGRFAAGQDVDPWSGVRTDRFGEANVGNYNPLGPGGAPGTRGIVSPSSPGGGGSFFGGPGTLSVPGTTQIPNYGRSGPINLGATSMGNAIAATYLRQMMKGLYTTPENFGLAKHAMPNPFGGPSGYGGSYQSFHQGQVDLGNFLRANPNWITQNFSGVRGVGAQVGRGSHLPKMSPN